MAVLNMLRRGGLAVFLLLPDIQDLSNLNPHISTNEYIILHDIVIHNHHNTILIAHVGLRWWLLATRPSVRFGSSLIRSRASIAEIIMNDYFYVQGGSDFFHRMH